MIDEGFCLKNDGMHWIDQRLPEGCKHHISANRDKQRIVEKIPEPTQRRAHAGLTEMQLFRRSCNTALLHERVKRDQQIDVKTA